MSQAEAVRGISTDALASNFFGRQRRSIAELTDEINETSPLLGKQRPG